MENTADNIISIRNVCKSFPSAGGQLDILKDITADIKNGEFVSVMGASGSGKSTLLYLLGALDKPTSGEIYINGDRLSQMTDKEESAYRRGRIGFVFQFYNLVPNLNVEENIMLPVIFDGKKPKAYQKKLEEVLEITGLTDRKKHLPAQLSGGQQQRTAIARALINSPGIILADEATGNLDSEKGAEIMRLFSRINKENGVTIIQVTHSQEAAAYGGRIILLKDGRTAG